LNEDIMGSTGRRYSTEFKTEAVRLITEEGRPVAEVARESGVSPSTLWRWRLDVDVPSERVRRAPGRGGPDPKDAAPESDPDPVEVEAEQEDAASEIAPDPVEAEAEPEDAASESAPLPEPVEAEAEPEDAAPESEPPEPVEAETEPEDAAPESEPPEPVEAEAEPEDAAPESEPLPVPVGPNVPGQSLGGRSSYPHPVRPRQTTPPRRADQERYPNTASETAPSRTSGDVIEVSEVIAILRRRVWLVVSTTVLCISLAAVLGFREIPRYRATAVLRLGEARTAMTQGIEAPIRESDRYTNPLLSQTQLLRSRSLLGDVVDSVGLRLRPEYRGLPKGLLGSIRVAADATADTLWVEFDPTGLTVRTRRSEKQATYGQLIEVDGIEFAVDGEPTVQEAVWVIAPPQLAVDGLLANLRVVPRAETNVVDIAFSHPDPAIAQQVANTLVVLYQQFEAQFAQERSRQRRIFLEEQLAQTDSSLARAQSALRSFQTSAQTYDARQELAARQQNRMVLDIRREELDAERRMYQALLDRLDAPTDEARWDVLRTLVSSPGIAENPAVSRIHQQLMQQRTTLDSLTTGVFGSSETNPDVLRQRQLIATSEGELTSAIRSHVASLDARSLGLAELAQRTGDELSALPYQMAEEARLEQFVQTYQKVSDQLREEYQKARMAEAASVGQADIIDLADLPYRPEPGRRIIILGVSLILGIILGSGGALVWGRRNQFVQSKQQLQISWSWGSSFRNM
jgi:uncharacterized protein involved in exopolysaccharide biosynthesis/transposase-like protein